MQVIKQRPIGILPFVHRIWAKARLRQAVRERWVDPEDFEHGGTAGRLAAEAAWEAALEAELAGIEVGAGAVAVLLDLSKCYERIPLRVLADRARAAGWPDSMVASRSASTQKCDTCRLRAPRWQLEQPRTAW